MTVKKTQQTLNATLEKTEQTLDGLENSLGNNEEASLLATAENRETNDGLPEGLGKYILRIPSEWRAVLLTEISNPKQWKTISTKNLKGSGYVVYGANGKIGFYDQFTHEFPTVMITCRGATCGNIHVSEPKAYINGNAMAIDELSDSMTLEFLKYGLLARKVEDTISGSAQPQITRQGLSSVKLPLPPLAEQAVIAQTLDTLLAQVDNIKTRLDAIPKILKTFRQSVLAAAVSGKLTEEWRGENECSVWDEYEFETLLREMRNGLSPKPNENEIGHPIFRISAVRPLEIDYSDMRYLECENKIAERYRLRKNDLLFTRYNGSLDFVGVCGMIKEEPKGVILYPDKLIRVRLKENVHPSYIELYFASPSIRKLVTDFVKSTSGQKGISGKDLKSVLVALPSFKEQTEIVRRVEELFAFADQIEQQVKNAQGRVNNLTQSILAKAFRGELTAQWRAENPDLISGENSAEALLAKIQEERDALKQKAKPKKKITAKKTRKKVAEK